MKSFNLIIALMAIGLLAVGFVTISQQHGHQHGKDAQATPLQSRSQEIYTCQMHPDVVSDKPGRCPKCGMKLVKKQISDMGEKEGQKESPNTIDIMGTPTFEQSVEGTKVRIWLITQEEHRKMMAEHMRDSSLQPHHTMGEGMKHNTGGTEHGMMSKGMEAMMAGTHHIMVEVINEKTLKPVADVRLSITSPLGKMSTVTLNGMMNHFGGSASLTEKGTYTIRTVVKIGDKIRTANFDYKLQN